MQIRRLVREARRRSALTQRELAARAGVPQSTVGRIEAGLVGPRWATVEGLLRATGMTLELTQASGAGIDRTQIRELLRLSPLERAQLAVSDAAGIDALAHEHRTNSPR